MAMSRLFWCRHKTGSRIWKMSFVRILIILCLTELASASLPCKDTKRIFQEVQDKLDTPLPVNYLPSVLLIVMFVLVIFVLKTLYDVSEHRKRMRYINRWDDTHLGEDGIKNEVFIPYPTKKN